MPLTLLLAAALAAAAPGIIPDKPDIHLNVPDNAKGLEVNVLERDIAPGETVGWHIHHGDEIGYVLSGELNLQLAGGPIRHMAKGDYFEIDRDTPHRATNSGAAPAVLLITYLKDKSGPTRIPVPAPGTQHR